MGVYLDNSATSFPKPESVIQAINNALRNHSLSPGRSGHAYALKASRELFETREMLAGFIGLAQSEKVIFTANATMALNMVLKGYLHKGDHVIISHFEHNSVHRPLRYLERSGIIEISVMPYIKNTYVDVQGIEKLIRPNTKLVACIHGSNVSGAVQPLRGIGEICRKHGLTFLVDAAQTAGFVPIDMKNDHIDILIFTGHKKLYGPTGIGGVCLGEEVEIETFVHGGSGSNSELDTHPVVYPDRLEAGTPNTLGIIGLKAGVEYVMAKGLETIREKQLRLTKMLLEGLKTMPRFSIYGPEGVQDRLPLVSINLEGMQPAELAHLLDREYGIMARPGLHCSPLSHKAIGTFPQGTLRLSIGAFTTQSDIEYTLDSLKKIAN